MKPAIANYRLIFLVILCLETYSLSGCASNKVSPSKNVQLIDVLSKHTLNVNESGGISDEFMLIDESKMSMKPSNLPAWSEKQCRLELQKFDETGINVSKSIDAIMAGFNEYAKKQRASDKEIRIKIFLHGGVTSLQSATNLAEQIFIEIGGNSNFYPIFVNWETGILSSYYDHLFRVRNGVEVGKLRGYGTSPFVFLGDLIKALGNTFPFVSEQTSYLACISGDYLPCGKYKAEQFYRPHTVQIKCESDQKECDNVVSPFDTRIPAGWEQSVSLPSDRKRTDETGFAEVVDTTTEIVPGISRILLAPLLAGFGQNAYENMLRRSDLLFLIDHDFDQARFRNCGALSRLFEEIRRYQIHVLRSPQSTTTSAPQEKRRPLASLRTLQKCLTATQRHEDFPVGSTCSKLIDPLVDQHFNPVKNTKFCKRLMEDETRDKNPIKVAIKERICIEEQQLRKDNKIINIEIIAHSMGGVVADKLLHRNKDLYFDKVVYMAGANTIQEFSSLALPYLQNNPTTEFYALSLHPYNEVNEVTGYRAVPEGTVLDWLDRYLTEPKSPLDHRFGIWNNLAHSLALMQYIESEERNRIHINVFGLGENGKVPSRHGHFNNPTCVVGEKCDLYKGNKFWLKDFWIKKSD